VRRRMGIDVEPVADPEAFMAIDLEGDFDLGRDAIVVESGSRPSVLWPLPGGRVRWTLQLAPGSWTLDEYPPMAQSTVDDLLAECAPWFHRAGSRVVWEALTPFEPALAARFGSGRACLAGDAAHETGALGIPSLNQGLMEARAIASWIARALRGVATVDDLDRYDEARAAA